MQQFDVFSTKFAQDIYLQKYSLNQQETWKDTAKRVVESVCGQHLDNETKEKIFHLIADRKFIPGGRYLYSAGRPFHQVNNCFLFRAEDSREGWAELMDKCTASLMTGGGIGIDYSGLREEGAIIRKTGGTSTGPIALMNMVNEAGRYIMQGGQRRCLPEDSLVFTTKGLVPIKEVETGDKVYTTKGVKTVLNKFEQGIQSVTKIETSAGNFLATPNHKMATLGATGEVFWKRVDQLNTNDFLFHFEDLVEGSSTDLPKDFTEKRPKGSSTCKSITIPKLDTDVAWYIGLVHGDGFVLNRQNTKYSHWSKGGSSKVSTAHFSKELGSIDKAYSTLKKFGTKVKVKNKPGEQCVEVTTHSQRLAEYFERYIKQPNQSIDVPDFIRLAKKEIRGAYLAGLVDSDGAIKNRPAQLLVTVYENFARQIQALYSSLGIPTRLKTIKPKEKTWQKKYLVCLIGFREEYNSRVGIYSTKGLLPKKGRQQGFFVPSDVAKKLLLNKNYRGVWNNTRSHGINYETFKSCGGKLPGVPVKINNIHKGYKCVPTYDIEVAAAHEFFCEGLLTHNSAIWAGLNWKHKDVDKFLRLKDWPQELKDLKAKDFNFTLPMELTNISVIYDTEFFVAVENKEHPMHKVANNVWLENCRQAFSTAEPGMSMNFLKDNESLRNACTEVTSEDDSDKCNLGTLWINRFDSREEFAEAVKYSTLFLLCGGVYSDVPTEKIKEVGLKNNRIGLGLGGMHEWLMVRGEDYEVTQELHKWLNVYEQESDGAAYIGAKQLGVAVPKGKRAIAPTGTIGIIAETTTGIEPLFCKAYKRRYLKGKDWVYQYVVDGTVKRLMDKGVKIENIKDAYDIDFKSRVKFQADVQNYVDMAISSTCNLPEWGSELNNEDSLKKNAKVLLKYAKRLRGFTCYPDGARGGQPLSRVELDEALGKEGQIFEENELSCVNGVCGI